jgi:hypothetical protein
LEIANNGVEDNETMLHMAAKIKWASKPETLYFDPEFNGGWSYWQAPYNFSNDFHVFGGLWDSDNTVSIFVDGRLLYKVAYDWVYDDGTSAGYARVILSLAIGGPKCAGGHGIDNSAFPQGFEADHVRVYEKRGQEAIGRDTIGKKPLSNRWQIPMPPRSVMGTVCASGYARRRQDPLRGTPSARMRLPDRRWARVRGRCDVSRICLLTQLNLITYFNFGSRRSQEAHDFWTCRTGFGAEINGIIQYLAHRSAGTGRPMPVMR